MSEIVRERLRREVLQRLGVAPSTPADLAGLRTIYRAWCSNVPFDNVRKAIAIASNAPRPLPGSDVEDFFENWLRHGTGGTCWPTTNALANLLESSGFRAARMGASMSNPNELSHGTVNVTFDDGSDWLVDSSFLYNDPVPSNANVFIADDPVFEVEVEDRTVWVRNPPFTSYMTFRVRDTPLDEATVKHLYEQSRERSPFNQSLYARRNWPGELRAFLGNVRYSRTVKGVTSRQLTPGELCEGLRTDIGLSSEIVAAWADAVVVPPSPDTPPVSTSPLADSVPPSMRVR